MIISQIWILEISRSFGALGPETLEQMGFGGETNPP
jgi:hypothetical protein